VLVLSRHRDEKIIIGDKIVVITIVDIRGDKVRLGIEAPVDLPIHREEVYNAIEREKRLSAPSYDPAKSYTKPIERPTSDKASTLAAKIAERKRLESLSSPKESAPLEAGGEPGNA